jgi:benzoyl-CoA reductase subunit C
MTAPDPWKPFLDVMTAPFEAAREWKERYNGKIIGHLLPDVPEEILHAAGALPVAIEGAGAQASLAQAQLPGYTCNHAMGVLEMGLDGTLDALDGMVIPYVCDTTRNLFHIWPRLFPNVPAEFIRLPKRLEYAAAGTYLREEFSRLAGFAGQVTGKVPSTADVAESVKLYNRSRGRLREAYALHKKNPSVWTTARIGLLSASALRAPREEHLGWMDALPWDAARPQSGQERIPLYVRGKVWDPPGILDLLDELGFALAGDEIVTGWRSVLQDAAVNGDLFEALAQRHALMIPYPGYHVEPAAVVSRFIDRVKNSRARGVLFLNPKFCEAAAFDAPDLRNALEAEKIPTIILETSARGVSAGQVRVRLEAFREMLAGDLL